MVTLDLVLIGVVGLGALNGYRTGFIKQILRLFGGVIAYFVSFWLRPYIMPIVGPIVAKSRVIPTGNNLLEQTALNSLAGAIAFGAVFLITFLLLRYAASLIDAIFHLPFLSTVNRLTGLAAGALLALIFCDVSLFILRELSSPLLQFQIQHSIFAQWIMDEGKQVLQMLLRTRSVS